LAKKKETEEKLLIKAFKQDSQSVWCNLKHWRVIDGELVLCAGGLLYEDEYNHVLRYFKNKKML